MPADALTPVILRSSAAIISTINVRGQTYLGWTRSISWLLMPQLLASPGHQHPWYWLRRIGKSLSYTKKDFNNNSCLRCLRWIATTCNVSYWSINTKYKCIFIFKQNQQIKGWNSMPGLPFNQYISLFDVAFQYAWIIVKPFVLPSINYFWSDTRLSIHNSWCGSCLIIDHHCLSWLPIIWFL